MVTDQFVWEGKERNIALANMDSKPTIIVKDMQINALWIVKTLNNIVANNKDQTNNTSFLFEFLEQVQI